VTPGGDDAAEGETARLEALRLEALRVNDRYLREVVIGFGLCPWAEHTLEAGEAVREVILDPAAAPESVLPFIDTLENTPEPGAPDAHAAAIGLLIFPRCDLSSAAFDRFVEAVRRADRARRPRGAAPPFMLAAFHPGGADSFESAAQMVSFVRRTPDPTIQLVRAALIDRLQQARPAVSDEITRANHAAVTSRGAGAVDAVVRAIRRDRDAAYAAILR
jgi:hypothetical protein